MLRLSIPTWVAVLGLAAPLSAQIPPPPGTPASQIQRAISQRGLASQLRSRLAASGLTPAQIRQRLAESGYDPSTLDPYLTETPGGPPPEPSENVLTAMQSLGIPEDPVQELGVPPPPSSLPPPPQEGASGDEGLRVFGLDVFGRSTTQFQPVTTGPVPDGYVLGPGDELVLILTGDVETAYRLPVTREGFVIIPQVGEVPVNGVTLEQLRDQMYTYLGRSYSGVRRGPSATTNFQLTLGRLRANQVFVTGEVAQPGSYLVSPVASVLNALYLAGGPTANGSFRGVQIVRGGRTAYSIDLYDYLLRGNNLSSIRLEPGDVIFVPPHGAHVSIRGEVMREAIYELKPGERLSHLIEHAGGVNTPAYLSRARIERILPPDERVIAGVDRTVVDADLAQVLADPNNGAELRAGDDVRIFAIRSEARNVVTLSGSVWHEGSFGHQPGLRAWDLIRMGDGLTPEAYLSTAHIERLNPVDSTLSIVPFSLDTLTDGTQVENPQLREFDVVRVFSRARFTDRFPVAIAGEVHEPLTEDWRDGMTVRDMILRAGGLMPTADLTIEVARLAQPQDRSGGQIAEIIKIRANPSHIVPEDARRFNLGETDSQAQQPADSDDEAAEFELKPYDRIFVRRIPDFELPRTVTVSGEVRFPGEFALERKDTRLREVIARAGGVTPTAFAEGFRLFRNGSLVNIELPGVLGGADHQDNLVLMPGDSMVVPEYDPVVTVQGAVTSPSTVLYRPGAGLGYYIDNAGGYARDADEGRVSVRYANGSARVKKGGFLFFGSSPKPGPGSTVFVPDKPESQGFDLRGLVADLVGIAASVATVILVIERTQ